MRVIANNPLRTPALGDPRLIEFHYLHVLRVDASLQDKAIATTTKFTFARVVLCRARVRREVALAEGETTAFVLKAFFPCMNPRV